MTTRTEPTRLLTEQDVAALTKIAAATLRTNRCRRVGIPYLKLGGSVRYSEQDVLAYIAANRRETATA